MYAFFLVLPLMAIIIIGSVMRSVGFYSKADLAALTKTLYWIILPALLFNTVYDAGKEILSQPNLFISANICYVATIALAWAASYFFFHKGDRGRIAVSALSAIRGNNIYLGLPIIMLAMGSEGLRQASVSLAVTILSFQVLSLAAGELAMSGRINADCLLSIFMKVIKNPMVFSCLAGGTFALLGIPIPAFIKESMKLLSGAATAVALLTIGGTLGFSSVRQVIRMIRATYFDCVMRLFISPLLMWLSLTAAQVPTELVRVTVMLCSMPAAVNVFIVSKEMNMDAEYGAEVVAATTALSALSIPVWVMLLGVAQA